MKAKQHPRSLTVIAWMLSIGMLILWLVCMVCITDVLTRNYEGYLQNEYRASNGLQMLKYLADSTLTTQNKYYEAYADQPGRLFYDLMDAIQRANEIIEKERHEDSVWHNLIRGGAPSIQAILVYDKEGNAVFKSTDAICFTYASQEVWEKGAGDGVITGYGWIDMGRDAFTKAQYDMFHITSTGHFGPNATEQVGSSVTLTSGHIRAMRISGYFESGEMIPLKLDYTEDGWSALSKADKEGKVHWKTLFDRSETAEKELITIYANECKAFRFDDTAVSHFGVAYQSLIALLEQIGYVPGSPANLFNQYDLREMILFDERNFGEIDAQGRWDYVMLYAISCDPLEGAIRALTWVYIVTFALGAGVVLLTLWTIRRNLTRPLQTMSVYLDGQWRKPDSHTSRWAEPRKLEQQHRGLEDRIRRQENEIRRLNQALDYAKKAEQSRRQLTSAVAHELKTPLAVVHSYTEGLKEHIAEEKRDRYLDTILAETERMDTLVLQMLDLSRLEAGRVKLARDTFSLEALVRDVFDRLEPAAREKQLSVSFQFCQLPPVHADAGRMDQVVMNLASNAVRYTPERGSIRVWTEAEAGKVRLHLANDTQPFTQEELSKIWESFYRRDKARHDKGTGLGLPIVRNIVRLHGGDCAARNTDSGVEFSIWLPQ